MPGPIKIIDIELSQQIQDIEGLNGYTKLQVLIRLHHTPIGYITIPVYGDRCPANVIAKEILDQHSWKIMCELVYNGLENPMPPEGFRIDELLKMKPRKYEGAKPLVTIAVCTRDRTDDLALCLDSLKNLDYPTLEILVIDNASTSDSTKELVTTSFPNMRYVVETRPGLDWARNRAILEAQGEIIAYTDDDVVVDSHWVSALAQIFIENDDVMAVTGLVVPYELETEAQILFEMYGGFGRGFERKWYRRDENIKISSHYIGSGAYGTGANMAFRRSLFEKIGEFDPALDVGTVSNGGGDLDMFFRVIQEGHTLVYEPGAIVRHRHRREYKKLREQITNNGIALHAHFVRNAINYPRELSRIVRFGIWWLCYWNIRRLLISFTRPASFPRDLILAEFYGSFKGLFRYHKARHMAAKIEQNCCQIKPAKETNQDTQKQMSVKNEENKVQFEENPPTSEVIK